MSVVGAAVAATLNTDVAIWLNVTPAVPELTTTPDAPVVLPIVIVLALAFVPILIAPVVVESSEIALAPVLLRARVVPDVTEVIPVSACAAEVFCTEVVPM
jgi:hypothetical protein